MAASEDAADGSGESDGNRSIPRDVLQTIGEFSARRRWLVVGCVLVVIALAAVSAGLSVQMSMGMELYVDDDSEPAQDWEELQTDFGEGNVVFVVIETEDIHDPETIATIDRLDTEYSDVDDATHVVSLADVVRTGSGGEIPETEEGVRDAIERVEESGDTAEAMVGQLRPDDGTTLLMISYGTATVPPEYDSLLGFLPGTEAEVMTDQVEQRTAAVDTSGMTVTVTGSPVFEQAAFGLMLPEMIELFALAFGVILVIVVLIMRGRLPRTRMVAFPLVTALLAMVIMMGVMGVLGYEFNAIMLGVMPIALGLGIDYSLQIQTRYVEERRKGKDPVTAAGLAARTIGWALVLAMGATALGLSALLASPVPPVRQFGVTAAASVVAAMVLAVTFLVAMLVTFDDEYGDAVAADGGNGTDTESSESDPGRIDARARQLEETEAEKPLERGMDRLGGAVAARPLLVVVLVLALVTGGVAAYPQVSTTQQMLDYWPDIEEKADMEDLQERAESPQVMYVIVEDEDLYTPETFEEVAAFEAEMESHSDVNAVMSPVAAVTMEHDGEVPADQATLTETLDAQEDNELLPLSERSNHPDRLLVTLFITDVEGEGTRELIDQTDATAAATLPEGTETAVTGKPVLNRNVIENVTEGLTTMTILSFSLGLLFLAVALRSLRQSLMLVFGVSASAVLLVALGMYIFGIPWNPLTVATASIVLGIGIDYGVHINERFREERLERGARVSTAVRTSLTKLSRPVLGSGLTTMFGFGVLALSDFPVLSNFGLAILLAMGFALLTAFTLLPALAALGARIHERRA